MIVPAAIRAELVDHATSERPHEACGLFTIGGFDRVEEYLPCDNVSPMPLYRFELRLPEGRDDWLGRLSTLGLFHSHVLAGAWPSRADIEAAWPFHVDRPQLIYSLATDQLVAFKIDHLGEVQRLNLVEP